MRHATMILVLLVFGCATDEPHEEEGEEEGDDATDGDVSSAAPTHNPEYCPGGSGGRGQPQRKHCEPSTPDTICLDCCYFNYDIVDGWQCRRYKRGSNNYNNCWAKAINDLAKCQVYTCKRHGRPPR